MIGGGSLDTLHNLRSDMRFSVQSCGQLLNSMVYTQMRFRTFHLATQLQVRNPDFVCST